MNKEKSNSIEKKESSDEKKNPNSQESLDDQYSFGWSNYAETTNGRFAMLGLLAILIIEILSKKAFLTWSGIIN